MTTEDSEDAILHEYLSDESSSDDRIISNHTSSGRSMVGNMDHHNSDDETVEEVDECNVTETMDTITFGSSVQTHTPNKISNGNFSYPKQSGDDNDDTEEESDGISPHEGNPVQNVSSCEKSTPRNQKGRHTYLSMVHDAIVTLKDRTGSSVPAITKFMLSKHDDLSNVPQQHLNRLILNAVKTGISSGRFVKLKCSYKVNSEWIKKEKQMAKLKENQKKARERKRKLDLEVRREQKKIEEVSKIEVVQEIDLQELADIEKKKQEEYEAAQAREEAIARAKEIADRIKKRKFPMDDLDLIAEDKELGVKAPRDLSKAPFLPYALTSIVPFDERPRGKKATPASVVNVCTTTLSPGTMGLISDVLSVYNFFRGDVGYCRIDTMCTPEFSLSHLIHSINEVFIGNAKLSRVVPPLISHLFVSALNILTSLTQKELSQMIGTEDSHSSRLVNRLHADLLLLKDGIKESSWGEILFYYLDLMDRFYTTEASLNQNALQGHPLSNADSSDFFVSSDTKLVPNTVKATDIESSLPEGYFGYLGPTSGVMYRAYAKLSRNDPWNLSAEELMVLLRSLIDDILAFHPNLADDISRRDEALSELLKAKKAAEYNFKKVRLAFEGPKVAVKGKGKKIDGYDDENKGNNIGAFAIEENVEKIEDKLPFKPTATRKEFETAERQRSKALEAYERGLKKFVARSEPIGFDKDFNPIYFFRHDPEYLFVEINRSQDSIDVTKSWHVIDNRTLFDEYISSLDVRGIRQHNLHEELTGSTGLGSLRRFLRDDNKKKSLLTARKREEEEFERRLENAKIACDIEEAGGRRSGRLANNAKFELAKILEEIEIATKKFNDSIIEHPPNFYSLTGLEILRAFDAQVKGVSCCSYLWNEAGCISHGVVGIIVSDILILESMCEELVPWDLEDLTRKEWRNNLQNASVSWQSGSLWRLGPKGKDNLDEKSIIADSPENNRVSSMDIRTTRNVLGTPVSISGILQSLKDHTIDLEKRIFRISGIERSVQEVDEAAETEATMSSSKECLRCHTAWKKKIHTLNTVPSKRANTIRDTIISAITVARKGHLSNVVEDLRSTLQLHRPGAASQCRLAALKLLEKYGGILSSTDETEKDVWAQNDDAKDVDDSDSFPGSERDDLGMESLLCGEAMMMVGCLDGFESADRVDWKEAVKTAKTISRIGALIQVLSKRAKPVLTKMKKDRCTLLEAVAYWDGGQKLRKGKGRKEKYGSLTDIWIHHTVTDEFVLGKIDGYPWWPARICIAKDPTVASSLKNADRALICFIGKPHLHVVNIFEELKPFAPECGEDITLQNYSSEVVKKFKQVRGQIKKAFLYRPYAHSSCTFDIVSIDDKANSERSRDAVLSLNCEIQW